MTRGHTWRRAFIEFLFGISLCFSSVSASEESVQHQQRHGTELLRRKVEQADRYFFKYITRPDIDAPNWKLAVYDEESLAPGYWFVAPYQELDQGTPGDAWVGPHIYDGKGELIWSGTGVFQHWNAFDFDVTTIDDQQMMTILFPHGKAGLILDQNYRVWRHIPLDGIKADMHAFRVIDYGKRALIVTHQHVEMSPGEAQVIGFNGSCSVAFVGFVELDLDEPAPPLFVWDAYHHIGLEEGTYNTHIVDQECLRNWDIM